MQQSSVNFNFYINVHELIYDNIFQSSVSLSVNNIHFVTMEVENKIILLIN